tara:strand:+ start:144 stop:4763 length:4620 start_codon:yes stop_codon:yes gene_type:complete
MPPRRSKPSALLARAAAAASSSPAQTEPAAAAAAAPAAPAAAKSKKGRRVSSVDYSHETPEETARRKRGHVIREIVSTEKDYIGKIIQFLGTYVAALERQDTVFKRTFLQNADVALMLSNCKTIRGLSQQFVVDVEETAARPEPLIGPVFERYAFLFRLYAQYASCYDAALDALRGLLRLEGLGEFLRDVPDGPITVRDGSTAQQLEGDAQMYFADVLIRPAQRVPRYRLLLEELLKRTPATHPDHAGLTDSLQQVREAATHINETLRQRERRDELAELSLQFTEGVDLVRKGRYFVKQGALDRVRISTSRGLSNKKTLHYVFHLFNDMLTYSEVAKQGKLQLHRMIQLETCEVLRGVDDSGGAPSSTGVDTTCCFQVRSPEKSFVVIAEDAESCEEWVAAIEKLQAESGWTRATDTAAIWKKDVDATACLLCGLEFGRLRRPRHHCRECGDVVCDACSPHRRWRSAISIKKAVRVCNVCEEKRVADARGRISLQLQITAVAATVKKSVRGDFYLRILCSCAGVGMQEHRVSLKSASQTGARSARQKVGSAVLSSLQSPSSMQGVEELQLCPDNTSSASANAGDGFCFAVPELSACKLRIMLCVHPILGNDQILAEQEQRCVEMDFSEELAEEEAAAQEEALLEATGVLGGSGSSGSSTKPSSMKTPISRGRSSLFFSAAPFSELEKQVGAESRTTVGGSTEMQLGVTATLSLEFEVHAPLDLTHGEQQLKPAQLKELAESVVGISAFEDSTVPALCSSVMAMIYLNALSRARLGHHGDDAAAQLHDLRPLDQHSLLLTHDEGDTEEEGSLEEERSSDEDEEYRVPSSSAPDVAAAVAAAAAEGGDDVPGSLRRIDTAVRNSLKGHTRDRSLSWREIHRETRKYRRITVSNLSTPTSRSQNGSSRTSIISEVEQGKLSALVCLETTTARQRALLQILVTENCFVHLLRTLFVVFVEPLKNAATGVAALPQLEGGSQLQSGTAAMISTGAARSLQARIAKEVQHADVKLLLNGVEQIITINTKLLEDLTVCFTVDGTVKVSDSLCVGTIFSRFAPLMAIYSDYARAETNALRRLSSSLFEGFRGLCESQLGSVNKVAAYEAFVADAAAVEDREEKERVVEVAAVAAAAPVVDQGAASQRGTATMNPARTSALGRAGVDVGTVHGGASASPPPLPDRPVSLATRPSVARATRSAMLTVLLGLPVQRVPQYGALLATLLEHTPVGHPDRKKLTEAVDAMAVANSQIKDLVRERRRIEELLDAQNRFSAKQWPAKLNLLKDPDRRLLLSGPLIKGCRKTDKRYEFFLFSDMMIYGSLDVISGGEKVKFHRMLDLGATYIEEIDSTLSPSSRPPEDEPLQEDETRDRALEFVICSMEKSFTVRADNVAARNEWVKTLKPALEAAHERSGLDSELLACASTYSPCAAAAAAAVLEGYERSPAPSTPFHLLTLSPLLHSSILLLYSYHSVENCGAMEVRQNEQSMHRVQKALRRLSPSEASLPSVRRYFLRSVFEEKAENRAHRFKETAARLRLVLRSEDAEFDMR